MTIVTSYREQVREKVQRVYGLLERPIAQGAIGTSIGSCLKNRQRSGEILTRRATHIRVLIDRGPLTESELRDATNYPANGLLDTPFSASAFGIVMYDAVSRGPHSTRLTPVYRVLDIARASEYANRIGELGELLLSTDSD